MSRYLLTPQARDDLRDIETYIAIEDSVTAALKVKRDLMKGIADVAEMPGMGHMREDLTDKPLRFWRVHSWLIVYRPDTRPVQIIRVLHGHQDIGRLL